MTFGGEANGSVQALLNIARQPGRSELLYRTLGRQIFICAGCLLIAWSSRCWARIALRRRRSVQQRLQSVPVRISKRSSECFVSVGLFQINAIGSQKFTQASDCFFGSCCGQSDSDHLPILHRTVSLRDGSIVSPDRPWIWGCRCTLQLCLALTGGAGPALQTEREIGTN